MSGSKRILVLGASGYIGRHLVAQLSAAGHQVTAAARHIDTIKKHPLTGVIYQKVDLHDPVFPGTLLEHVDTLYYLVHSMGDGEDFLVREQQAAVRLREALKQHPVRQIIFLSSLQGKDPRHSSHLQARQLTGDILRDTSIPVTELRAGIVIGSGSAAFEVMRDMVYNLPVLTPHVGFVPGPCLLHWKIYSIICCICWTTPHPITVFWKPQGQKYSATNNNLSALWPSVAVTAL